MEKEIAEITEMISFEGFKNVFFIYTRYCESNREAYEKTEKEYLRRYSAGTKYASYDSFRKIKNRNLKSN